MPVVDRLLPRDRDKLKERIEQHPGDPEIKEYVKTHVSN